VNGETRTSVVIVAFLAFLLALSARQAQAASPLGAADSAIGEAKAAVAKAASAQAAADAAQKKANDAQAAAEAPQKKADAAAQSAAQAAAIAKRAADARDAAEAVYDDAQHREPADKKATDAAREKYEAAKRAAEEAQRNADKAKAAADAAAAKANDEKANAALKEKADAAKAAADAEAEKAKAAKKKAQDAITAAEKAVDDIPDTYGDDTHGSKGKRKRDLDGVKNKLNTIAFGPTPTGDTVATLTASGKLSATFGGTGQTIGNVVNLTLKNLTTRTLSVGIPATVLSSASGSFQPYLIPYSVTVSLAPGETKTVPLDGVCLDARKPPVDNGKTGELVLADPKAPDTVALVSGVQNIMTTAERLQGSGAFTTPFSADPAKEIATIIQWTTWVFTSTRANNPVTRADLANRVNAQVGTTATPEQRAQIDRGVDQIWGAVQLTGAKAKVL